jgi:putative transposase
MTSVDLRKGNHVVFRIYLHVTLVAKYRFEVLTTEMLEDMKSVFERVLKANRSELTEFSGEPDHVQLLIDLHPDNNISNLVASLKSASSRILRQKYPVELKTRYWGKNAKLWHDSKCIVSVGGAPLEVVKQYIQSQSGGKLPTSGVS